MGKRMMRTGLKAAAVAMVALGAFSVHASPALAGEAQSPARTTAGQGSADHERLRAAHARVCTHFRHRECASIRFQELPWIRGAVVKVDNDTHRFARYSVRVHHSNTRGFVRPRSETTRFLHGTRGEHVTVRICVSGRCDSDTAHIIWRR
ncbi:hypothetical protein CDO52_18070 [Nocardiopsis gilva YIM 90087]|uniref:Ig-like domain-containing protein n=1 Tax=Nocardiopsis gilva YIM 90087 TaxID=1235441 RepID=A0A223S8K5_9ACTN|nr:hypothetical protein [Nocardiopsis gilva]ASU84453.1 hypothetical protein CDO52_18070 [Nocardiopsis gilva YIM 90087]